jgi:hypothetical protein
MLPHVSAAMQLIQNGKRLQEGRSAWGGRSIDFVFVNADHPNPLRRVMPAEMINGDHHYYDCEKYQEMLLDVAETVLGWNGFKRECLGLKVRQRSFLEELRTDSRQEILREIMTLEGEEEGG